MAGPRGGIRDARPPSKFLNFDTVFWKNWLNNRLASPPLELTSLGKSSDSPLLQDAMSLDVVYSRCSHFNSSKLAHFIVII